MTINDRIKHLRKNILRLSQEEFAQKIDISRSNLGNIEVGRINVTERLIIAICRAFMVNKEWLLQGTGPMYVNNDDAKIDELAEIYRALNETSRKYLKGYVDRLLEEQAIQEKAGVVDDKEF